MATELLQSPIRSSYEVSGPAAGVMADQQYLYWQEAQERAKREQELNIAQKVREAETAALDAPVKAAERELKLATNKADLQTLPTRIEETLAKSTANKSDAELKVADNRADFVYKSSQQFPPDLFKDPDPAKQAMAKRLWDEQKAQAERLGIKMPEFSPQGLQEWQAKGQQSDAYIKYRQKTEAEAAKEAAHMKRTQAEIAGRKDVAEILAATGQAKAGLNIGDTNRILNIIDDQVKKGEPVSLDQAKIAYTHSPQRAADQVAAKDREEAKRSEYLVMKPDQLKEKAKEFGLPEDSSPTTIASRESDIEFNRKAVEYVKSRWPDAKLTSKKATSGEGTSSATTPASTQQRASDEVTEEIAKQQGVPYNIKKYEYAWRTNPKTGRRELAYREKK